MSMGLFTALAAAAFIVVTVAVILGIIYMSIETQKKIKARTLKKIIKNEKRLDGAALGKVHSKDRKSVKGDVLKAGEDSRFAELTVTGKSTAFLLRNGQTIKV